MSPRVRLVALAAWLLACVLAWFAAPHSPAALVTLPYAGPDVDAPLGGDQLGRDVLSQTLRGGQLLILLAAVIAMVVTGLAAVLGAYAALEPRVGVVVDAVADVLILVPPLLGVLVVVLGWSGGGVAALVLAAVLFGVPYSTRVMRASAAAIARRGHVDAARTAGESSLWLITREVLPSMGPTVMTQLGLRFTEALYVIAAAGFLRLPGVLGDHNWAVMVRDNTAGVLLNPWGVLAPSLGVVVTVVLVQAALPRPVGDEVVVLEKQR